MKKVYFVLVIIFSIFSSINAQKKFSLEPNIINMAQDQDSIRNHLRSNIGVLSDYLFYSYEYYHYSKDMLSRKKFKKKYQYRKLQIEKFKMYVKLYDTLAYRDVVSHPSPSSEQHKWQNVYKSFYPLIDKYIKIDSIEYNYPRDDSTSIIIEIARMTGPNQIVYVCIGQGWYEEYTVEFSDMYYNTTLTKSKQSIYSNNEGYLPEVSYVNAYYNANARFILDIEVKLDDRITIFKGKYTNPTKKLCDDPYYKYRGTYSCDNIKYRPIPEFLNRHSPKPEPIDTFFTISKYLTYRRNDNANIYLINVPNYQLNEVFKPVYWSIPRYYKYEYLMTIGGYLLYPIEWHSYYNAYGLLIEKTFYVNKKKDPDNVAVMHITDGLLSKYEVKDSVINSKKQVFTKFSSIIDTAYVIYYRDKATGKTLQWPTIEKHKCIAIPYATIYPYRYPTDIVKKSQRISYPSSPLHLFEKHRDMSRIVYYNDGEINLKKMYKRYYLKYNTYYRVYPSQIKTYYEQNKIRTDKNKILGF